jgi:CRP-like cAMP-binding protein
MADLADTIRAISLFSGLSREDIAKILGRLEEKFFPAGTTILSQGDKGDSFYIIQSGAVQVVLEGRWRQKESIAVLGPQKGSVKWRFCPGTALGNHYRSQGYHGWQLNREGLD